MPTNTQGTTARKYHTQQIHYLRKSISFEDAGTVVPIGILPAGAVIHQAMSGVSVNVAFDGDTTNTLDIGVAGTAAKYASALALGTIGFIANDAVVSNMIPDDIELIATVVSTAAAAAGQGVICIAFTVDND